MNFEKDIFVSYAHIDNESLIEGDSGWISEFHRALEIRLSQLLGERPKIWRDTALDGNHRFSEEIVDQFDQIAILISIISPRYVQSDWCVKEIQEFSKAAKKNVGVYINNHSRIFKIIKTPVELSNHPEEIQGLLGYEFFKVDQETKRVKELGKMYGPETQQEYWSKLDDLAHDISQLLTELKKDVQASAPQTGSTVFLAETTLDKQEEREKMKRWLFEKGHRVLPDKNLSLVANTYKEEVLAMLQESNISIHLVGENYGLVLEGTSESKVVLQNAVAAEVSRSKGLKRVIWSSPNTRPSEERQVEFLDNLQRDQSLQEGADYIVASLEDLKFDVDDKLSVKQKKEEEKVESDSNEGPKQVYLICEENDLDNIGEVEDFLFDEGFEVMVPAFEGEQSELRQDHQENLINCDAVIIYYGEGTDIWARSKVRDLLKIAGYGRKVPLKVKATILGGKETPQKKRFRSQDMTVVNMIENADVTQLKEITQKIKG